MVPTRGRGAGKRTRPPGTVSLRVLMFGWEFPPFQAGGLGTATRTNVLQDLEQRVASPGSAVPATVALAG